MICVFPSNATDFASNGLCVLTPTACSVTETLNGEWELSMTHPLDERDKWTYLQIGSIIRAPVPATMTPRVSLVSQTTGWSVYTMFVKLQMDMFRCIQIHVTKLTKCRLR
ncbi:MAG: hypothetical protein PUC00_04730 [Clostridiales bacterium]|nr:hypothetical protein [Clostridiales bacterium]